MLLTGLGLDIKMNAVSNYQIALLAKAPFFIMMTSNRILFNVGFQDVLQLSNKSVLAPVTSRINTE